MTNKQGISKQKKIMDLSTDERNTTTANRRLAKKRYHRLNKLIASCRYSGNDLT